jgi:hypothetical protein
MKGLLWILIITGNVSAQSTTYVEVHRPDAVSSAYEWETAASRTSDGDWLIQSPAALLSYFKAGTFKVIWPIYQMAETSVDSLEIVKNEVRFKTRAPVYNDKSSTLRVRLSLPSKHLRLISPQSIFSPIGKEQFIFSVDESQRIKKKSIFALGFQKNKVLVLAEFSTQTKIVSHGLHRLRESQPVQIINAEAIP